MAYTSPELHLIRLLSERFDVHELYRALVGLSDEAPLKARLMVPTSTTPLAFATHAVSVLTSAGRVQRGLFAALVTQREPLAGEIWGVAGLFGVSHPDAAPVEGLPEHFAALAEAHAALGAFIGRAEQLALLRATLLPSSGPARPAVVCNLQGMAGVGKSFLVERFYAEHLASFPGGHLKITLGYDAAPTADGLLSDLAERLGVLQGPGQVEDRVRGAALAARPLIHLDNLDDESQAEAAVALTRRLPGVPLVLGGRYQFGRATPGWRLVPIEPFSVSDALAQLDAELVPDLAERVDDAARRALVGALGGLPLAIHLAASYLNAGYEVGDFLGALAASGLSLKPFTVSDTAYLDRAERALRGTFELSLKALRVELGEQAERGLRGVAALGVAPLAGAGRSWMEAIVGAPGEGFGWVSCAVKLSIVQHDLAAGRWRVHKLLGEHLKQYTDADATARMDAWVLERLPTVPDETRGARWNALQAEHEAVAEWVAGLDGARAVVGGRVGYAYAEVSGPYIAWIGAATRALQAGPADLERSTLLSTRGFLAWRAGDYELALQSAKAKEAHDRACGWEIEAAIAASLRANLLESSDELEEALRVRREEVLPVVEQHQDIKGIAVTKGQIADLLRQRGALEEALRIYREEVLPLRLKLDDTRGLAITLGQIADTVENLGRHDEALQIRRDHLLPAFDRLADLRWRAHTLGRIAQSHRQRGESEEALKIWRAEVLPLYERLGDDLWRTRTLQKIASALTTQGLHDQAYQVLLHEVLPGFRRLGNQRMIAGTLEELAVFEETRGQPSEALRSRRAQAHILEALSDRRSLLHVQVEIARTLVALNKPEHTAEARALLLTAEATAIEMNLPDDLPMVRLWFHQVGLSP